ncbi:TPA: hypothetical protein EYP38_05320, partial [Candidatus Micrarchaeota archaeon]|nr:hypothetical protein [Candidatus Micrarchaeota archaeon]
MPSTSELEKVIRLTVEKTLYLLMDALYERLEAIERRLEGVEEELRKLRSEVAKLGRPATAPIAAEGPVSKPSKQPPAWRIIEEELRSAGFVLASKLAERRVHRRALEDFISKKGEDLVVLQTDQDLVVMDKGAYAEFVRALGSLESMDEA